MDSGETLVSLKIPTELIEKIDTIAKLKYLNREGVIIDACAYYCQFYDMHSEEFPETMRSVFFNLARHDDEFRKLLRQVVKDNPTAEFNDH
jgi:metal-responsive CopG/Arc/MetJ family transcriptional regulator